MKGKEHAGRITPPPSPLPPVGKPRLLIVEDDESIRTQMKWALMQDYEVFLSEDRAGALDLCVWKNHRSNFGPRSGHPTRWR